MNSADLQVLRATIDETVPGYHPATRPEDIEAEIRRLKQIVKAVIDVVVQVAP